MNTTTLTLQALAEPNRMRIIELLRDGPSSVGEIAKQLWLRQPQVSKHLRTLSDAGLVVAQVHAQQRIYRLQPQRLRELDDWLNTFSRVWDERLDGFDKYLQTTQIKEGK